MSQRNLIYIIGAILLLLIIIYLLWPIPAV